MQLKELEVFVFVQQQRTFLQKQTTFQYFNVNKKAAA
jgi:hypothetical protein